MAAEKVLEEYDYYRTQAEALRQNLELINNSLVSLEVVREGLEEIKGLGKENEVLVPIGAAAFVKARILDTEQVIISLGSEIAARKPIPVAREDLDRRMKELEKVRAEQGERLSLVLKRLDELAPQVQRLLAQAQGGG